MLSLQANRLVAQDQQVVLQPALLRLRALEVPEVLQVVLEVPQVVLEVLQVVRLGERQVVRLGERQVVRLEAQQVVPLEAQQVVPLEAQQVVRQRVVRRLELLPARQEQ